MNLTNFKPQEVGMGDSSTFIFNNEVVVIEPKIDGIRVILEKRGNVIKLYSRLMRDWTDKFNLIIPKLLEGVKYENCIIDGEMAVIKDKKFTSSNFLMKNKLADDERYVYWAFDILEVGNEDLTDNDIETRKEHLQFGISQNENLCFVPYRFIDNDEDLEIIYKKAIESGMEGVVLKNFQPYNKSRYNWIKKKPFETLDLEIMNKKEKKDGKGWIYGLSEKGVKVASTCSIKDLQVGQVVEIKYEKKYPKGDSYSLRFPKIFRVREDKTERII